MARRFIHRWMFMGMAVVLVVAAAPALSAEPGDPPIGGQIFVDLDRDGAIDAAELLGDSDPLYPPGGVNVTVYDSAGASVAGVTTSSAGGVTWSANVTGLSGSDFRVEFSFDAVDSSLGFNETVLGPDSATSVTFASAGDSAVNFGVVPPAVCASGAGHLWTSCFVSGERASGGPLEIIVDSPYDLSAAPTVVAQKNDVGSVWGLAYDEWTGTLYSSAFVKRSADLGPEGVDGLYWNNVSTGTAGGVSLTTVGGPSYGAELTNRQLGAFDNPVVQDVEAFALVGKRGIGDIDLTPDGRTLLVANIEETQKLIDVYDVTAVAAGGNPAFVRSIPVPNPGCSNDDYFPFATTATDYGTAYIGVTCTAQTSELTSDLAAHVVEIDIFGATAPGTVLTVPLDYERGCALYSVVDIDCVNTSGAPNPLQTTNGNFQPWTDDPSPFLNARNFTVFAQPMFSDVEVDDDGSLVLGFSDRIGHQLFDRGDDQVVGETLRTVTAGEVLRVCNTSGDPLNPIWVVEGLAGCAGNFPDASGGDPGQRNYHSGPNDLSEYYGKNFHVGGGGHHETSHGGLYIRPGSGEVVLSILDPINADSGGLSWFDNTTGANTADLELFSRDTDAGGYLGKAASIGDVEGCFLPVSLGDFVWLDLDRDGIQDAGELPLAGVTVTITGGSLAAPITVVTDANGQWGVTGLDGIIEGESYTVTVDPTSATNLPSGMAPSDLSPTVADASAAGDRADSDLDPATLAMTTSPLAPGESDHSYDAGFTVPFDLALDKTLESVTSPLTPNGSATMLITVTNQGSSVAMVDVADYINPVMWQPFDAALNTDGAVHANSTAVGEFSFSWDDSDPLNPVVTITRDSGGVLSLGETVVVPITLRPAPGFSAVAPLINLAEISNFDNDENDANGDAADGTLTDVDSTPDAVNGNGPGENLAADMVDDEIDEDGTAGGDEDDHDIVAIPVYDLELIKTTAYTDFTATPPTVTFDLTVNNQGLDDVYWVDVIDYGAPGLTFDAAATAAAWTAAGVTGVANNAPTFTIEGPVAPGGSATIPVVYELTDLSLAPFTNAAEISAFDNDADPANTLPTYVVDADSTPDAINNDAVIDHNENNYDPDNDNNLTEPTTGDEDDHDIETIEPFDLALQKRLDPNDPDLLDGVSNGDEITFSIEVFNQASPVEDFDIADYVSSSWIFDPALNQAGTTTGDQSLSFIWDLSTASTPVVSVDGALANGESIIIPITLTVNVTTATASDGLYNFAEIARFDNDGDPSNGDSDPSNPNNPADGPLTDIDSTPDTNEANDTIIDDVTDNSGGDEDDHDLAFTRWWDLELIKERPPGQTYLVDFTSTPPVISYQITVNNQGDEDAVNIEVTDTPPAGMTFDSLDSFIFSSAADAAATVSTPAANIFELSQLSAGATVTFTAHYSLDIATTALPVVNGAEISGMEAMWDPDGPAGPLSDGIYAVTDIDSVPDSDPTNDALSTDGVLDPADSHNTLDNDPDGDGNLHNPNEIDEDDHDTEAVILPFDLALAKTFVSNTRPLVPGGTVTMHITVTNQGPPVEQVDVVDYLDPAHWEDFDPTLNPATAVDPASTAAGGFSFTWDTSDPANPVARVMPDIPGDKLETGETIVIPIMTRVAASFDGSEPLVNFAEIARFDFDGDPNNGDSDPTNPGNPPSGPLLDVDSTPDAVNGSSDGETVGGDLVDDAITVATDEDDHDIVTLTILDLALRKTIDPVTVFPVSAGDEVTFSLEVFNQGATHAAAITVVDYVDPAMWEAFDTSLNPGAASYGWAQNANGQDGDLTIAANLAPDDSVIIPVTLTVAVGADLEALLNTAEISAANATNADGAVITNPDGSRVLDIDSVADTTNSDPTTDNVIDGSNDDEDDHDIAFVAPPTYSLGNQVWFDANNNGMLDAGEDPIAGVLVHLFSDTDRDGAPDDLDGDGNIDAVDALATATTGPNGEYLFDGLEDGDYIVGVAPDNALAGGPLDGLASSTPTSANSNDDVDSNDDGTLNADSGYVLSGPVTLDDAEPLNEAGLNNETATPDALSNLTIDFGFWQPVFDLALEKTLAIGQDTTNFAVGDDVTYTMEVFNQGNVAASGIELIDYVPAQLHLNDSDWSATAGGDATIDLGNLTLASGASVTVDVTMTILAAGDIDNHAEITSATALDPQGEPLTDLQGAAIVDIDSNPDTTNSDVLSDGVIDADQNGGDEDDHDIASISAEPAAESPPTSLAITGVEPARLLLAGFLLAWFGIVMAWSGRGTRPERRHIQ